MNDTESIWNNILSCTSIDNSRAKLIGKLYEFINTLNKWRKKLSKLQYLTYWHSISKLLIDDFFYKSEKIKVSLQIIQKKWTKMINDSLLSNYNKKISINVLKKNFIYITNYTNYQKFLPGTINFCHPSAVCYIPFKIICIIGLDYQYYLKRNISDNFNLLKKYPLVGDVNIYDQNSYLFLQMISCAKENFYISYVGFSIEDNTKKHPSELIDQLFNYIVCNFCFIGDKNLNIRDNTKKIFKHFYKKHKKISFYKEIDIENITVNNAQNILKKQNIKTYKKKLLKPSYSKKISLENLIKFWKNPIRHFINIKFNIKFQNKQQPSITTESFLINPLDRFKINTTLLKNIIHNQDIQKLFKKYTLSGTLPYGFFGIIFLNKKIKEMKSIAKLIAYYRDSSKKKEFNLIVKKYQVHGVLHEIQNTGLLRWKANAINHSDRMSLWLEHLIYSALGETGESKIIGYKEKIWSFSSLSPDIAYNYLLQYIKGYIYGIQEPLFFTKSGACWIDKIYDIKKNALKNDNDSKKKGYKTFLKNWIGNDFHEGEKEDFYIKQIIKELNKKNIKKIYATSKKWLLPILKHKKYT